MNKLIILVLLLALLSIGCAGTVGGNITIITDGNTTTITGSGATVDATPITTPLASEATNSPTSTPRAKYKITLSKDIEGEIIARGPRIITDLPGDGYLPGERNWFRMGISPTSSTVYNKCYRVVVFESSNMRAMYEWEFIWRKGGTWIDRLMDETISSTDPVYLKYMGIRADKDVVTMGDATMPPQSLKDLIEIQVIECP